MNKNVSLPITANMRNQAIQRHRWLVDIIERAGNHTKEIPFFQKISQAKSIEDFRWVKDLFHHSRTLPRFIGQALALETDDLLMRFYAGHLEEEAPHSSWNLAWLKQHEIIRTEEEIYQYKPTIATSACINYGCRLSINYDRDAWLVGINCGIEKCSHIFFSSIVKILDNLGLNDKYFQVHVEADEYHSTDALVFIDDLVSGTPRADYLRDVLLEGVSLWCGMLNSWVKVNQTPNFESDGSMI